MKTERGEEMKKRLRLNRESLLVLTTNYSSIILLVILSVYTQIATNGLFFNIDNLLSVTRQTSVSLIMCIGFTLVVACGGFDLSVSNILALTSCVYILISKLLPLPLTIILTLAVGCFCGLCNGLLIEGFGVSPFIITFASGGIFRGIAELITNGQTVGEISEGMRYFGRGTWFGVLPVSFAIALIFAVAGACLMRKTLYGRFIIATGGNRKSAAVSGIRVKLISISTYVIMGFCIAAASVMYVGRVAVAYASTGTGIDTTVYAAVLIGGTSVRGGRATMLGTLCGCLLMGVMNNMFTFMEIGSYLQRIVLGIIIVIAVALNLKSDKYFTKMKK